MLTFNSRYGSTASVAVVEVGVPEPLPVKVTITIDGPTATALGKFIASGGKWADGMELNSILHNLRPALQSAGISI